MNCLTLQDIVRFGIMILTAVNVLAAITEGARTNVDYPIREYDIAPKPRSKPREIRGFKPHSMSTAIGFGKRQMNSYELPKPEQQEEIDNQLTENGQRFPAEWFFQFLKMNPRLQRKVERNLLFNGESVRPRGMQTFKKKKGGLTYYYDE